MKFDEAIKSYLHTSFFVESPMYYDAMFNEQMNDIEHNREVTQKIVSSNKPFDKFQNWDVYKVQDGFDEDQMTFCLVRDGLTDAFMEIVTNKGNNFSRGVWQRNTDSNKGLIRNLILNFLPKYYTSLISDKTANKLGIEFYRKLLNDCIQKGLKVTVLRGSIKNEIPFNLDNFDNYWHNVSKDVPTHPTFVTTKDDLFKIYFS
jgi:hypothetical protein